MNWRNVAAYQYGFNGMERDDEYSGSGNAYTATFWEYDSRLGRRWNIDSVVKSWESSYASFNNSPIWKVDPNGDNAGEFEKNKNGEWKKSTKVGDKIGVNFYHHDIKNADGSSSQITTVEDQSGNRNFITDGRKMLEGMSRSSSTDWDQITNEWAFGYGPEKSIFEGDHPANNAIKRDYLYGDIAKAFEKSGKNRSQGELAKMIPIWDNFGVGNNMQVQMMGSFRVNLFKLGDKTLSIVNDTKTRHSSYYHGLGIIEIQDYDRGQRSNDQESTTYQNYLFFK